MPFDAPVSFEELRWHDYAHGRRGGTGTGGGGLFGFGARAPPPPFSAATQQPAFGGGVSGPATGAAPFLPPGTSYTHYTPSVLPLDGVTCTLHVITAMPCYAPKSFEELRWEDYAHGCFGGTGIVDGVGVRAPPPSPRVRAAPPAAAGAASARAATPPAVRPGGGLRPTTREALDGGSGADASGETMTVSRAHLEVLDQAAERAVCQICCVRDRDAVLPCGHAHCAACTTRLDKCPECAKTFTTTGVRKLYLT